MKINDSSCLSEAMLNSWTYIIINQTTWNEVGEGWTSRQGGVERWMWREVGVESGRCGAWQVRSRVGDEMGRCGEGWV